MFNIFKKKEHRHVELERQLEFILMLQIGLLRRFNLSEDEMAQVIGKEQFVSEMYLHRLVELIQKEVKND